jgi:hypothetical protein
LIDAALQIGFAGKGSIRLDDLRDMCYVDLKYAVSRAKEIIKKLNQSGDPDAG